MTREETQVLCNKINAYWRRRGVKANARPASYVAKVQRDRKKVYAFQVKSDLTGREGMTVG